MGIEVKSVLLGADATITSAGATSTELLEAIGEYRTGCRRVDDPALFGRPFVAGGLDKSFVIDKSAGFTRLEGIFISVVNDVLACSGVDAGAQDSLLIVSSTKGNIDLLTSAGVVDKRVMLGEMSERIASATGFNNTPLTISNACISGLSAIIVATRLIREGLYRNVVVAGGDILTRFVVTGFHSFRSVSERVCRPYDISHDGLTLGEGCGALLLTSDPVKATEPYVEVAGGAVSGDANHISGPSRTGDALYFAIRDAMAEAEITSDEVGFVNGHGTGTLYNDDMESKAFALAGLDKVPVNGLKPYFGHTLGAAGVVETIVCARALRTGLVYGTPGLEKTGTPCPVDVSFGHRATDAAACVKTASGFGGCNAAIVLRKTDGETKNRGKDKVEISQTASVRVTPDGRPFREMIRERFKALKSPYSKFFKMDDLSRLAYVAAGELLGHLNLSEKYRPDEIGIVLANRSASLDTDIKHCLQMERNGDEVSPAVFVYTLPNVAAAEISIRHKIQGENMFFIQDTSDVFVESYARMLLRRGHLKAVVCGWCELLGEEFEAEMKLIETIK